MPVTRAEVASFIQKLEYTGENGAFDYKGRLDVLEQFKNALENYDNLSEKDLLPLLVAQAVHSMKCVQIESRRMYMDAFQAMFGVFAKTQSDAPTNPENITP